MLFKGSWNNKGMNACADVYEKILIGDKNGNEHYNITGCRTFGCRAAPDKNNTNIAKRRTSKDA